jgi:hypothetical protein
VIADLLSINVSEWVHLTQRQDAQKEGECRAMNAAMYAVGS